MWSTEDAGLVVCDTVIGHVVFNGLKDCSVSVCKVRQPAAVTVFSEHHKPLTASRPRRLSSGALPTGEPHMFCLVRCSVRAVTPYLTGDIL